MFASRFNRFAGLIRSLFYCSKFSVVWWGNVGRRIVGRGIVGRGIRGRGDGVGKMSVAESSAGNLSIGKWGRGIVVEELG